MKINDVTPLEGGIKEAADPTAQLCDEVAAKTKKYNPDADDGEAEFDTTEKIGWWGMVSRERSGTDLAKFCVGAFAASALGAALPAFCLVFGEMIDGVADTGSSNGDEEQFNAL